MYCCKFDLYFWLMIAILVALASCQQEEAPKTQIYFDSAVYMSKEIAELKKEITNVDAVLSLNGVEEIEKNIPISESSFDQLEQLFAQANINQAKFVKEYTIDTFWMLDPLTNQNIEVLNYTTENEKLKVKWMQVYSDGSLKASYSEKNFLFSYEKEIYYQKDQKFSTISWQKTFGLDTLKVFNEINLISDEFIYFQF